jgi:hypothetical protein
VDNFLLDNPDITFHLEHLDLDRIIRLFERDFAEAERFPHAPADLADAKDSIKRVLELVGEIAAEYLAPYAAEVDEQGVKLVDGEVELAPATSRALDALAKADLMGFCLPRQYGGLNMPTTALSIAAEILSRADGSFLNFGLQQDIGETLAKFADEPQKAKVIPRLSNGSVGSSMVLTESEAGSDLQAVNLKATLAPDGTWRLNGVKRFITNGCGEIALVLARSEDGSKGAGGLSFFLYERDKHMTIRRVEHKLGIHGSATCELQFNDAPAELVGQRRRGLTKYTLWLMNSARLGVAAQAVGIAEAAYREARKYAGERVQFGEAILAFPAVFEMLTDMRVAIEAGRALLYETARFVDLKEGLEHLVEEHPERETEVKSDLKLYTRLSYMCTPMAKLYNTEMANKVTYDAIQIHGGSGYMKDFNVERHARDARITNIYEGTSQLQVVAAITAVTSGTASAAMDDYDGNDYSYAPELLKKVRRARTMFEKALVHAKEVDDETFTTFHSRRLVEMATDVIIAYLMLRDAKHAERKMKVAELFVAKMLPRVEAASTVVCSDDKFLLDNYKDIIG